MKIPLNIRFHEMEPTELIEERIRERANKLDKYFRDITRCEVVVDVPHQHHHKGKLYRIRIDITVPNNEIVASNESTFNHAHEDVYVAIRDAFDAAQRQLETSQSRQDGEVKQHAEPPRGQIVQLFPAMDYGLIETIDGREIYFHRNSVKNANFDELAEGAHVTFVETAGEEGPQASVVHTI